MKPLAEPEAAGWPKPAPGLCPKAGFTKPEVVELAPKTAGPNTVVGAAEVSCPKTGVGAALVVMVADGAEEAAVVTTLVRFMAPAVRLSVPPEGGAKIEPGFSDVGAEDGVVAGVSCGAGVVVEVLVVSGAGSETGSAAGGSETGASVSDGGLIDGGVEETSRVGGVRGLLEGAVVGSVFVGAVASVTGTADGALKVGGLGLGSAGGSLDSVSVEEAGSVEVVVSGWRDFVGRVSVSDRGARNRLSKEVAAGGKEDVEGMVKLGFIEVTVPSCGLKLNVDIEPNPCAVVIFGASAAVPVDSDELPVSAGLICAEMKANPVDPLPGCPKVKPKVVLGASFSSSLWPTLKSEKVPRVSPALTWALGA